jgi:hypothetical protein
MNDDREWLKLVFKNIQNGVTEVNDIYGSVFLYYLEQTDGATGIQR